MNRSITVHNAFQSAPQLNYEWNASEGAQHVQPLAADLGARRSISDSVLQRGCPAVYNHKNTAFMLVSRSGGSTVKQVIDKIIARCEEAARSPTTVPAPCDECSLLAQFAGDAYYNVVIAGRQGVKVIVCAMRTWPNDRGLQECCCIALGNLCLNGANLAAVEQSEGVSVIIAAMRMHPNSVAVQASGCDAMRNMGGLIAAISSDADSPVKQELEQALSRASAMYLLPIHRRTVETLLDLVKHSERNR